VQSSAKIFREWIVARTWSRGSPAGFQIAVENGFLLEPIEVLRKFEGDRAAQDATTRTRRSALTNACVVVVAPRYQPIWAVGVASREFPNRKLLSRSVGHARQAGKSSVAFGGQGQGSLRGLLHLGGLDDGGMALLSRFDLSEIRGVVFLLFCAVTISLAINCTKKSADGINFRRWRS
jgi:hypothetical protein